MKIKICKVQLLNLKLNPRDSDKIRGFIGNKYIELDVLHNHLADGFIYRYPKVQYKVINGTPIIIGIDDAADIVAQIGIADDVINIDGKLLDIHERKITDELYEYGSRDDYISYKFSTPWIALNQENISKYRNCNEIEKEKLLKSILIGNLISMSKGFGYTVEKEIMCWLKLEAKEIMLKNKKHICFEGEFKVNFEIPDYLGIGKFVSRGFGTVMKTNRNKG